MAENSLLIVLFHMANDTAESCFSGVTVTGTSELREVVVSSVSETADLDKSESAQN
jgi:hypothetical protein